MPLLRAELNGELISTCVGVKAVTPWPFLQEGDAGSCLFQAVSFALDAVRLCVLVPPPRGEEVPSEHYFGDA